MGLLTQDPELYKIVKFRVNWANIEQDTTIQNRKNLLRKDKCPAIHTFFSNFFKILSGCILFSIDPINTKLEDFVKLGVLFLNIGVLC